MRVETNCSGCVAAVLVLTLEPRPDEVLARCQARQTRAAGWDFDQAGQPRCPDCRARAQAVPTDVAPAPAVKKTAPKARKR